MGEGGDSGVRREGPFWEVIAGRAPAPPAAELLGWELIEIDPEAGTIEVAFDADERFLNPVGQVQGGFLAAMLDDTLGRRWWRRSVRASGRRRSTSTCSSWPRPGRAGWSGAGGWCGAEGASPTWPVSCSIRAARRLRARSRRR